MIPEKRNETQCNQLCDTILNGFNLADKNNRMGQLCIVGKNKQLLIYDKFEGLERVVVIKREELIEARENIDSLNYFCIQAEENDVLKVDHIHIFRQHENGTKRVKEFPFFLWNKDTSSLNQKQLIITQIFSLNKAESKMIIYGKDEFVFRDIGHGVSLVSELWRKVTSSDDSVLKIILFLKHKKRHRKKKR